MLIIDKDYEKNTKQAKGGYKLSIKIDKTDKGCCDIDCTYKKEKYCTLYKKELIGAFEPLTRCPQCNDYA